MTALALVPQSPTPVVSFNMDDIKGVAEAIAKGGLFGSKDPYAVLTLCLLAHAEGQHPAVVFRDYHIIQGKPAKKSEAMLRDFIMSGGKVEWHTLDDTCADATFSHNGGGAARIDWTMDRAKKAGLATQMWSKYPRQMLRSRVISEGVRTVFPGATSGLYVPEEVAAFDDRPDEPRRIAAQVEVAEEAPPAKRQVLTGGPYTSKTALWKAVREFDRELRGCGDIDQLEAFVAMDESVALLAQCALDAPQLLDTGEGMPDEFVPLNKLIAMFRAEFTAAANEGWREDMTRSG